MENFQKLNRLKAVLADAGQTNKWLAEQLGKNPVTVSKWCTNTSQPDLQTLAKISDLLKVNIYNPQNEMFRLLGTKRSFSQNETFFFSHPYPALFRLISHF